MSEELTPLQAADNEVKYYQRKLLDALDNRAKLKSPVGKLCSFTLLANVVDEDENGLLIQLAGNRFAEFWVERSALDEVLP